ncbi:MAG: type II and III secretion system protein family protein [Polymorphobacter sp.]
MLLRTLFCVALLAQLPATTRAQTLVAPATSEVAVAVGSGRLIRLDRPAASLFVADATIADVQERGPTLVYLTGKKAGTTTLYAVDGNNAIIVNLGVAVGFDAALLHATLARLLPGRAITASAANDALVLSGTVNSAADASEAVRIAARFVADRDPKSIINRLAIDAPTQINLRVRIVEVSRDIVKELGFNWNAVGAIGNFAVGLATGRPFVGGAVAPPSNPLRTGKTDSLFGAFKQGSVDLNVLIDALDERGLVTLLAEPNLTALSGMPASFLAGGEYPIPVPQGLDVTTIEYKKFGVSLSFVATIVDGGRINLQVKPEVSQLSTSGAIQLNGTVVPALTTRRAETTVDLASGQSFAIAGLLQNNSKNGIRKFPGLGDIPVLGALFRSTRYERNETELVIIVTPYLVRPASTRLMVPGEGVQ